MGCLVPLFGSPVWSPCLVSCCLVSLSLVYCCLVSILVFLFGSILGSSLLPVFWYLLWTEWRKLLFPVVWLKTLKSCEWQLVNLLFVFRDHLPVLNNSPHQTYHSLLWVNGPNKRWESKTPRFTKPRNWRGSFLFIAIPTDFDERMVSVHKTVLIDRCSLFLCGEPRIFLSSFCQWRTTKYEHFGTTIMLIWVLGRLL